MSLRGSETIAGLVRRAEQAHREFLDGVKESVIKLNEDLVDQYAVSGSFNNVEQEALFEAYKKFKLRETGMIEAALNSGATWWHKSGDVEDSIKKAHQVFHNPTQKIDIVCGLIGKELQAFKIKQIQRCKEIDEMDFYATMTKEVGCWVRIKTKGVLAYKDPTIRNKFQQLLGEYEKITSQAKKIIEEKERHEMSEKEKERAKSWEEIKKRAKDKS